MDCVTPVDENTPPVFHVTYDTLEDLLTESETEIEMTADVIDGVYSTSMVQAAFMFCDPFTMLGKPIILRQSLNERLDVSFANHTAITDKHGQALNDPCRVVFLANEMLEF